MYFGIDDIMGGAWRALQEHIVECPLVQAQHTPDFHTSLRGGIFGADHRYLASDAQVAQARPGLPRQWCREYKVSLTSSFSIAKYSELGASRLALEFCRKCQHFYDIWLASDAVNFKFGADQLN